jgi:uncharacterized membrane protein
MDAAASPEPVHHASAQHKLFWVAVSLKFLNGVLELTGGTLLMAMPQGGFLAWAHYFFDSELANDPNNMIANWLMNWATRFQNHDLVFISLYLIFRGVAKIVLSAMLLRGIKIAYPMAIVAFSIIDLWAIRHLLVHFSWLVLGLLVLDIIVIAIITREWLTEVRPRTLKSSVGRV